MKVSVLGAGNGGFALAFHLVQLGHEVLLFELDEFKGACEDTAAKKEIVALKEHDGEQATLWGTAEISYFTTDIKEAIDYAHYIMLIVPAYAQATIFKMAAPHMTEKHVFISLPGNLALFDYARVNAENSDEVKGMGEALKTLSKFTFVEVGTIPYACRKVGTGQVLIARVKDAVHVGVFPKKRSEDTLAAIKSLFHSRLIPKTDVVEAAFCNLNIVLHPSISVFNAGWIESPLDFRFYNDGLTPGVQNIMLGLHADWTAIAESLGYKLPGILTLWKEWYTDTTSKSLVEFAKNASFYKAIKAPRSLDTRYIIEDIEFILMPMVKFAAKPRSIATPIADVIITSAGCLIGKQLEPSKRLNPLENDEIYRAEISPNL